MFLIKLEDMHVVNFKTSEDRNTQANCKECVAHHESEPHHRTAGFYFFPKQISFYDFLIDTSQEQHEDNENEDSTHQETQNSDINLFHGIVGLIKLFHSFEQVIPAELFGVDLLDVICDWHDHSSVGEF